MDVDFLISAIFKRPTLWDKREQNHRNRFVLDKLWDEVANEVKTQKPTVRNKWKALRDKFRATWTSIQSKSGEAGNQVLVSWKHFESLKFLKDQFNLKESSGNILKTSDITLTQFQDDFDDEVIANQVSLGASRSSCSTIPDSSGKLSTLSTKSRKRHSASDSIGQALLDIEIQKLQYLRNKRAKTQQLQDNEDLYFFKSIMPAIEHLPALQKLSYRLKILQVTREFLSDNVKNFQNSQTKVPNIIKQESVSNTIQPN